MNFNVILLTFLLLIICIVILIIISPIIDHLFYIDDKIDKMDKLKMYSIVITHIIILGIFILFIHYFVINKFMKYFRIIKHEQYIKLSIDLVLTLTLVGLQRNLTYKLQYISNIHPIRSKLIK